MNIMNFQEGNYSMQNFPDFTTLLDLCKLGVYQQTMLTSSPNCITICNIRFIPWAVGLPHWTLWPAEWLGPARSFAQYLQHLVLGLIGRQRCINISS